MDIDVTVYCDNCDGSISEKETAICSTCYNSLSDENDSLKERIQELEDELNAIKMG